MRGVCLSWYGRRDPVGFTSTYTSWEYLGERPNLANTQRILATTCDMRIPLTFSTDDCLLIAEIIRDEAKRIFS